MLPFTSAQNGKKADVVHGIIVNIALRESDLTCVRTPPSAVVPKRILRMTDMKSLLYCSFTHLDKKAVLDTDT